jgi:hypothetical protein
VAAASLKNLSTVGTVSTVELAVIASFNILRGNIKPPF